MKKKGVYTTKVDGKEAVCSLQREQDLRSFSRCTGYTKYNIAHTVHTRLHGPTDQACTSTGKIPDATFGRIGGLHAATR